MFNLSGSEIVVILLLALVVLGPEKLPDAMRKFGKTYAEFKKMATGFQQEFKSAIDEPMREMRETADLLKKSADFSRAPPHRRPPSPRSTAGRRRSPTPSPTADAQRRCRARRSRRRADRRRAVRRRRHDRPRPTPTDDAPSADDADRDADADTADRRRGRR